MDALTGRIRAVVQVAALQAGREGQPVLATGLIMQPDGGFLVYEQKGWWDGGQARLVTFRVENDRAVGVTTLPLNEDSAWFVGVTQTNRQLLAMTEGGQFFALDGASARPLFSLPNDAADWKQNDVGRFAGLAYGHGLLYIADRKNGQLLGVDPATGDIKESAALPKGADIRAIGGDDHYLWLVNYGQDRRLVIRMRSTQGALK